MKRLKLSWATGLLKRNLCPMGIRKLLLVMFTSILVMASSSATANQNNSNDLDLIFGTSATQSIELASLSDAEMVATSGDRFLTNFFDILKNPGTTIRYVEAATKKTVKSVKNIVKSVKIDGFTGSRVVQVRVNNRPVFRIDNKANLSPAKVHVHFGNMKYHRPWYAPWKKY